MMPGPLESLSGFEPGTELMDPGRQEMPSLNGPQKAAIVIAMLGPDSAGPVIEKIGDQHLKAFIRAFENMKMIPREVLVTAVEDFITKLQITSNSLKCGQKEARQLAEELLDDERAEKIFGSAQIIEEQVEDTSTIWSTLAQRKPDESAAYLEKQRPQMVSIVLAQLTTDRAGEILAEMEDEISRKVVSHLAKPSKVDPKTLATIGKVVEAEFLTKNAAAAEDNNPLRSVSEIFSVLPTEKRESLMEFLISKDELIAEKIRKGIVTFEDLPDRLPRNAVSIVFRELDPDMLLKALKHAHVTMPGTVEYLYSNISQRMADQYKEQIEDIPVLSTKDGEAAQSAFMSVVSRLDKERTITLIKVQEVAEETIEE